MYCLVMCQSFQCSAGFFFMIELMQFRNFKVLRDTQLPLGRFTLIVGPNGSGKSTAMQALRAVAQPGSLALAQVATAGLVQTNTETVEVIFHWGGVYEGVMTTTRWSPEMTEQSHVKYPGENLPERDAQLLQAKLAGIHIYALHTNAITIPVGLSPNPELR